MTPSEKCYTIIRQFEGCKLKAYQDSVGVWTIGYGTTIYPNGSKVKEGDVCTQDDANLYLKYEVILKSKSVNAFVSNAVINQNQFDALVSFAYNLGIGALKASTLLKKLRLNANDPSIELEFLKWNKIRKGKEYKVLNGLTKRRQMESDLYFS